jgi:hypothetical protein
VLGLPDGLAGVGGPAAAEEWAMTWHIEVAVRSEQGVDW